MTPESIPRVLIPAAGFGKRAGFPESKEMLPRRCTGRPLIEQPILLALNRGWKPLVITRKEKRTLTAFVKAFKDCEILEVTETEEWPDSLLKSRDIWSDSNIVILPDTEFSPLEIIDEMNSKLREGAESVFSVFEVSDASPWGMIAKRGNEYFLCEKPKVFSSHQLAWGLFGFKKNAGEHLLKMMLESTLDHQWKALKTSPMLLNLSGFSDLTRLAPETAKKVTLSAD
jgi:hypothetical protein